MAKWRARPAWQRWGMQGEAWQEWFRRSPLAIELFTWWNEADDYLWLVGEETYWEHVVGLLGRVSRRDCAAAGLCCARRADRVCREPSVCRQDPAAGGDRYQGPVPGGCGMFYGYRDDLQVRVVFSDDDRHQAVLWCPERAPVRLWVDGVPVGTEVELDTSGHWVGGRFFVVRTEGPGDHPRQSYGPGALVSRILSVLIHDVELGATQVLVPRADECWTGPIVRLDGTALRVYADQAAGEPDRTLPIEPR
jgi:hypothetical protein